MTIDHSPAKLIELFCTPPPRPALDDAKAARLPRGAAPLEIEFEGVVARGFVLGDGPAALLVHGWGSRALDWLLVARALVDAGFRVHAYDGPAHGATPGHTANLPMFSRFVATVAESIGPLALAVGHSLGASACAMAASGHPMTLRPAIAVEKIALLNPPDRVEDMFDSFLRDNGLPASLAGAMRDELERVFEQSNREYDVSAAARRLSQPLLVVHDRDDEQIPFDRAELIVQNAPAARPLASTAGLGHGGALRSRDVARAVAAFAGEK